MLNYIELSLVRVWSTRLLFAIGAFLVGADGYADETLLDYVQMKQQQSRALLDNYARQYVVTIQSDERIAGLQSIQTRRMAVSEYKEGQRLRLEVEEDRQGTNGGAVGEKVSGGNDGRLTQSITTVNENEAAHWEAENGEVSSNLTVWRHSSPGEMQHSAAGRVKLLRGIDPLDFAFGLRNALGDEFPGDIASTREQLAGLGTFRAAEVERDGAELIEITHEIDGRIWLTATIDPARGYATTSITTSAYPDGAENIQHFSGSISLEEVAAGVWAPVGIELSQQYSRPEADSQSDATVSFVFQNQAMDQHFEPEFFQWTTMNYPGDDAFLYDLAGVSHVMKVSDAELQPAPFTNEAKLAPEAVAAKIMETSREEGGQVLAPIQAEGPPMAPGEPVTPTPDVSPTSPLLVVLAVVGAAVLVGGLGVLAWRRS